MTQSVFDYARHKDNEKMIGQLNPSHRAGSTEDIANALATWKYITAEIKEFDGLKLGEAKEILFLVCSFQYFFSFLQHILRVFLE